MWQVVEGKKKTADGKTQQFVIQEIPEDRYDDVVNLMCDVFVQDEPTCVHFRMCNKRWKKMSMLLNCWIGFQARSITQRLSQITENYGISSFSKVSP